MTRLHTEECWPSHMGVPIDQNIRGLDLVAQTPASRHVPSHAPACQDISPWRLVVVHRTQHLGRDAVQPVHDHHGDIRMNPSVWDRSGERLSVQFINRACRAEKSRSLLALNSRCYFTRFHANALPPLAALFCPGQVALLFRHYAPGCCTICHASMCVALKNINLCACCSGSGRPDRGCNMQDLPQPSGCRNSGCGFQPGWRRGHPDCAASSGTRTRVFGLGTVRGITDFRRRGMKVARDCGRLSSAIAMGITIISAPAGKPGECTSVADSGRRRWQCVCRRSWNRYARVRYGAMG